MLISVFDCGFHDSCKRQSKVQSTVKTRQEADFVFEWMAKNDKVYIDIEHTIKRFLIPVVRVRWTGPGTRSLVADNLPECTAKIIFFYLLFFRNSLWQWIDADDRPFEFPVKYRGSLASGNDSNFCDKSIPGCSDFQRPALTMNLDGEMKNQFNNVKTPLIGCEFDLRTKWFWLVL